MTRFSGLKALLAATTIGIIPTAALADHHGYDRYCDRDRDRGHADIEFRSCRDECTPAYAERRVWVEPVYRTVCDRVWIAPLFQKVCERVWVPDRYEKRRIIHCNKLVTVERVLVQCAHYETREREIVVTPGHFENVERQELVCAGHWETFREPVAVSHHEHSQARLDLRLPFHW